MPITDNEGMRELNTDPDEFNDSNGLMEWHGHGRSDPYILGMVWSGALWDLRTALPQVCDQLVYRSLTLPGSEGGYASSFTNRRTAVINADALLYPDPVFGGRRGLHHDTIANVMAARGIGEPAEAVWTLDANTRWQNTITLTRDLIVPAGVTLTIEPTTIVQVQDNVTLTINGNLTVANNADLTYGTNSHLVIGDGCQVSIANNVSITFNSQGNFTIEDGAQMAVGSNIIFTFADGAPSAPTIMTINGTASFGENATFQFGDYGRFITNGSVSFGQDPTFTFGDHGVLTVL